MSMKPEVRERIRAEMLPLIRAWQASGELRRVFAARHGMSLPKFDYWVRQAGLTRPRPTRAVSDLAAVTVVPSGQEPGGDRHRVGAWGSPGRADRARRRVGADRADGLLSEMLTLSPAVRMYLATGATDLRRSIDGLVF